MESKFRKIFEGIENIMQGSKCIGLEPTLCSGCEKRARKVIKLIRKNYPTSEVK